MLTKPLTNQNDLTSRDAPLILCIDDDPDIVSAIEMRLRKYDLRTVGAFTGMQGIWHAANDQPDLIITDVRMPQGDGICVLECLKRNAATAAIPVIVLSGLGQQDLQGRVRNLGAVGFVRKPVDFHKLIPMIRSVISFPDET